MCPKKNVIDATSVFHQGRVEKEAIKLLPIVTNMGPFSFTIMPQGVCNSSSLWNILNVGNRGIDNELNIIKNMDNLMLYGKDGAKLEKKL